MLRRFGGDAYERFRREVEIVRGLDPDRVQILPILDARVPARASRANPPWYVMPLATAIQDAVAEAVLVEKVDAVLQIAQTLADLLAEHSLHHRDIKPENLYQHRGRFVVGDFGLARRPEDPSLTGDRPLGPWLHLPSEVFVQDHEPDWEKVDVHCLANTLWRVLTGRSSPPRGPILAGGEYGLTRYLDEDYVVQLERLIAGATTESPARRPTLAQFAEYLTDWIEGRDIRDSIVREDERIRRNRHTVLRWLTAYVRKNPVFDSLQWDVPDPNAPSGIDGLTEGDVAEALNELEDQYLITGTKHELLGGRVVWSNLYPTIYGVEEVEDLDVLMAQAAPLVRELMKPVHGLLLPQQEEEIEIGRNRRTPAEAYFQLQLLEAHGLVTFRDANEARGGAVFLLDVATTPRGREWLVANYASR